MLANEQPLMPAPNRFRHHQRLPHTCNRRYVPVRLHPPQAGQLRQHASQKPQSRQAQPKNPRGLRQLQGRRQLAPSRSASASRRVLSRHLAHHSHCRPPSAPPKASADRRQPPVYPNSSPDHHVCNSLTPLPLSSRRPSVSIGGFGLRPDVGASTLRASKITTGQESGDPAVFAADWNAVKPRRGSVFTTRNLPLAPRQSRAKLEHELPQPFPEDAVFAAPPPQQYSAAPHLQDPDGKLLLSPVDTDA